MPKKLILLSIPGLREKDVAAMPQLREMTAGGEIADLDRPAFPASPAGAGQHDHRPAAGEHGVVANGFYWRERGRWKCGPRPTTASSGRRFGTCFRTASGGLDLGRLVPAAQQGLRGRLRLHARPDPQSRRLRIALVLHAAAGTLRRAARRAGTLPLAALSGARWPTSSRRRGSPTRP